MPTTTLDRAVPVTVPDSPLPEQPKRLSDALRRGARLHPQGKGALYRDGKTCALGAILVDLLVPEGVALRDMHYDLIMAMVRRQIGVDLEQHVRLPTHSRMVTPLWSAIIGLNDTDGWSREQIADWLGTLGL